MKKLLTTVAVLAAIATPALAQSHMRAHRGEAANAYATPFGAYETDGASYQAPRQGTPGPIARDEEMRLDVAKGEIGQ
jgi:hypothetical protein